MGKDRKQKERRRAERRSRADRKRHELFDDTLKHAGLTKLFKRMSPQYQAILRRAVFPVPVLVFGEGVEGIPEASEIRRKLEQLLRSPSGCDTTDMSPRQWLCVFSSLNFRVGNLERMLKQEGYDMQQAPWNDLAALGDAIRDFAETKGRASFVWYLTRIHEILLQASVMDERIFWYRVDGTATENAKIAKQITLGCTRPETTTVTVDGKPRPAFRCTLFWQPAKATEISWPRSQFGMLFGPEQYPVYMQQHALRQLEQRVPGASPISITSSLADPRFVMQSKDSFLIEFRYCGHKVGYFAGNVLADKILIKTFLFLTMQGTPESDLLYKKLRLARRDIEYLRLDELSLFSAAEVRQDAELAKLFRQCGCGHLLEIDADDLPQEFHPKDVAMLKKYLLGVDLLPPPQSHDQ